MLDRVENIGDNIADEVSDLATLESLGTSRNIIKEVALKQIDEQIAYEESYLYWLKMKRRMYI